MILICNVYEVLIEEQKLDHELDCLVLVKKNPVYLRLIFSIRH